MKIAMPFDSLKKIIESYDVEKLSDKERKLVPFIVILSKELDKWKAEVDLVFTKNNGSHPKNFQEQQAFRKRIQDLGNKLPDQENYTEAFNNVGSVFNPPNYLPDPVPELLQEAETTQSTEIFWSYLKSLSRFIKEKGRSPCSGNIPDFHSDTKSYVAIKNAYNAMAAEDAQIMLQYLKETVGKDVQIDEHDFFTFCKNWHTLACHHYRTLEEEFASVSTDWINEGESGFGWYFVIRAADTFQQTHGKPPGPADVQELTALVTALTKDIANPCAEEEGATFTVESRFIEEMCRAEGAEIVTISSIMGGIASQEIIKMLTRQFTPVNNTLIFEGARAIGFAGEF